MSLGGTFIQYYTGFFEALGLTTMLTRFLFGSAVGFGTQLLVKPKISYHSNGTAKQFLSETYLPWHIVSILPGLIFGLLL